MIVLRLIISMAVVLLAAACGGPNALPSRAPTTQQALTQTAEFLEFETVATRGDLFREVARASLMQAGHSGAVMFPILRNGEAIAAPGIDPHTDLLMGADAGAGLQLTFDNGEAWAEDRRDSFQGLSEREAAELVARSLLNLWGIQATGPIAVERASGAPWAVAYVDGILRVNPSFVYMAAAPAAP
jgi:hypothetical protein